MARSSKLIFSSQQQGIKINKTQHVFFLEILLPTASDKYGDLMKVVNSEICGGGHHSQDSGLQLVGLLRFVFFSKYLAMQIKAVEEGIIGAQITAPQPAPMADAAD